MHVQKTAIWPQLTIPTRGELVNKQRVRSQSHASIHKQTLSDAGEAPTAQGCTPALYRRSTCPVSSPWVDALCGRPLGTASRPSEKSYTPRTRKYEPCLLSWVKGEKETYEAIFWENKAPDPATLVFPPSHFTLSRHDACWSTLGPRGDPRLSLRGVPRSVSGII